MLIVIMFQSHSKKPSNDDVAREEETEIVLRMTEHFLEITMSNLRLDCLCY